ncbi:MAG: hypothetical protein ACREM6_04020, partial [Vulcanimicrobiaceae bacterium]
GIDARPWLALGAFVATAAAFEAIGRAGNGVDAALAFRYTTPSSLGWIAVVGLAAQTASPRGWRTGMIAVIVAVVTSDVFGYLYAYSLAGLQRDAFAAIHRLDRVDDEELGEYTADPATVRALAARLRAARLGPFAHDGR